jgi:uncharacterized protein YndB with AHSA1/START domain
VLASRLSQRTRSSNRPSRLRVAQRGGEARSPAHRCPEAAVDAERAAACDLRVQAGSDDLVLELARVLPARAPVVFAAFTDAEDLARWWGPRGFSGPSLDFQARVGTAYRIEMQPPEGDPFFLAGEFREVDPPARLAYTFAWEEPDPDDVETLVVLSFQDRDASTAVALTQGPFKTEARRALHRDGWTDSFDKLEPLLREA